MASSKVFTNVSLLRDYMYLLSGFFVSTVGNWLYQLALPLLVYAATHSAVDLAITFGLTYLPFVLFSPFGGVLADRADCRQLLVVGDLLSAMVVGLLALLVSLGIHSIWVIYPLVFLLAGLTPFYHPAFQSFVPRLVHDRQLAQANAWLQGAENIVAVVGPLIGGLVIAILGVTSALFLDALSFLASALLIFAIRSRTVSGLSLVSRNSSWMENLREGLSYTWTNQVLRYGSLVFLGANFALTAVEANYVYFLTKMLAAGPAILGIAFALPGLGAILGAFVAPILGKYWRAGPLILLCSVIAGLMMLPLLLAHNAIFVALLWAVVTAFGTINAVTWFTLRQRFVPQQFLGRVVSITRLIAFAAVPISAVINGLLLGMTQNMYLVIVIAALIYIGTGTLGFFTPLYHHRLSE